MGGIVSVRERTSKSIFFFNREKLDDQKRKVNLKKGISFCRVTKMERNQIN